MNSDGSGVPAHSRSLISAFTFSNRIVRYFRIYNNNRDSVKTAWARLPIWSFFLFAYGRSALFPCCGTTLSAFCFFSLRNSHTHIHKRAHKQSRQRDRERDRKSNRQARLHIPVLHFQVVFSEKTERETERAIDRPDYIYLFFIFKLFSQKRKQLKYEEQVYVIWPVDCSFCLSLCLFIVTACARACVCVCARVYRWS